jgi:MraZ protein
MDTAKERPRAPYNGVFRHGVDDKRRVQVPSKWRPTEPGSELTVILWPKYVEGACLRVLPPNKLADLMGDLDRMPNSDPNKGTLKRYIGSMSVQVALDKVGRICLPDEMAKGAGITDEAVLVGVMDKFEIWSAERYRKIEVSDAVLAQEAMKLLE